MVPKTGEVLGEAPVASETEGDRLERTPPVDWLRLAVGSAAVGLCTLAGALWFGGVLRASVPWLDGSGGLTRGGLPVAELLGQLASAVTIGLLLAGGVLLSGSGEPARKCLAAVRPVAAFWAVTTLVTVLLSNSYLLGKPAWQVTGGDLLSFGTDLPTGRALVAVAVLAAFVSVARVPPVWLLAAALAALLPPVLTSHAMTASNHALAVFSMAVHIVSAALWVGGLVVLVMIAYPARAVLHEVVPRYSTLALACFLAVAASGALNAWMRLGEAGALFGTHYGLLVVAKTLALCGLAGFGWWHRRASIPALRNGSARTFLRLAAAEVLLMVAAMALATGLSRTEPPAPDAGPATPAGILLGFDPGGPPSVRAYALDWWIDPLFFILVCAGAVLYLAGVLRLRRRGERWPLARTLSWFAGLAIVLVVTSGGLARYSMMLFSAHMVQHLVLTLIAPIPLVRAAPVALALRTLDARTRTVGRTYRDLLVATLDSRTLRALRHPAAALALAIFSLYGFYASPLFEASLRSHPVHSLTMLGFLAIGTLYLRPAMRGARWLPLAALPFHALFGLGFIASGGVLAAGWYNSLDLAWGTSALQDQQTGGRLALAVAVCATVLLLIARPRVRS